MTDKEQLAVIEHPDAEMNLYVSDDIQNQIDKEKAWKLNNQIEDMQNAMEANLNRVKKAQEDLSFSMDNVEIMPVYSRVLVKPFKLNPFQKVKIESGIITDVGGLNLHTDKNPITGKEEELEQFIQCGEVIEVGPECKYVKPGDAVFFRKDTTLPVPFFKFGFVVLGENQILATVNEKLSERW